MLLPVSSLVAETTTTVQLPWLGDVPRSAYIGLLVSSLVFVLALSLYLRPESRISAAEASNKSSYLKALARNRERGLWIASVSGCVLLAMIAWIAWSKLN